MQLKIFNVNNVNNVNGSNLDEDNASGKTRHNEYIEIRALNTKTGDIKSNAKSIAGQDNFDLSPSHQHQHYAEPQAENNTIEYSSSLLLDVESENKILKSIPSNKSILIIILAGLIVAGVAIITTLSVMKGI